MSVHNRTVVAVVILCLLGSGRCSNGNSGGLTPEDAGPAGDVIVSCVPGEARCSPDGNERQVCAEEGDRWVGLEQCPGESMCENGACSCGPCAIPRGETCLPVGVEACPEGWTATADCGCEPVLADCPEGSMPLIGGNCHQVGSPCPETWFGNADGGCEPILDDCPDATLPLFGGGCFAVGVQDDCGQGTWGGVSSGNGGGTTWYVWGGYEENDSNGTKWKPFKTISEAVELLSAGDTILVGAEDSGREYPECVSIYEDDITLAGRCSELVTISGETKLTSELSAAVRAVYAEGVSISGVTVSGPGGGIGFIGGGGHRLENVSASGNGDNLPNVSETCKPRRSNQECK